MKSDLYNLLALQQDALETAFAHEPYFGRARSTENGTEDDER